MVPRITFLDAGTVDLGDLRMIALMRLGRVRLYRDTPAGKVVARSRGMSVVVTNKCLLGRGELARLPDLRMIALTATGVNNVDLAEARRRGVAVANVPGYSSDTVAEHTLMFLLALGHRLREHHEAAISGRWYRSKSFALLGFPFSDLKGKVLGIVGYGAIGRRVGRFARMLGMQVRIGRIPGRRYRSGPRRQTMAAIFSGSDFVTIHAPLTPLTYHLVGTRLLRRMKPNAYLLNLARGPIVDEPAVVRALRSGRLAGYAADVMEQEPPPLNHPFFRKGVREKVLLTPHIAWASREARQRLVDEVAKNIEAFLNGKRRNRVV